MKKKATSKVSGKSGKPAMRDLAPLDERTKKVKAGAAKKRTLA